MTEPIPGARLKQAGSAAQSSLFQRKFPVVNSIMSGWSNTQFTQSLLSGVKQITWTVYPTNRNNLSGTWSIVPWKAGDYFLALSAEGNFYLRGRIISISTSKLGDPSTVVISVDDNYNLPANYYVTNWAIQIFPGRNPYLLETQNVSGGSTATFNFYSGFNQYLFTFVDISFDTATRSLLVQPDGDTTAADYRGGVITYASASMAVLGSASLVNMANIAAATTMSGWVQFSLLANLFPFQSLMRDSAGQTRSVSGYWSSVSNPANVVFSLNGSGAFDNGTIYQYAC